MAGWLLTAALAVTLLLSVGHGLLLSMDKGTSHRTGLDLLAAGALLGLGMKELLHKEDGDAAPPGWTRKLDQFCAMPLPLLLAISAALEVVRPDALFLFIKTAGSLLLIPLLTLLLAGPERVLTPLERYKQWLFSKGDLLVGLVSVSLAVYLGTPEKENCRLLECGQRPRRTGSSKTWSCSVRRFGCLKQVNVPEDHPGGAWPLPGGKKVKIVTK